MSETKKIYELIPKIAEEIGAIGKDKKNAQQGYNFRGIDDVYNAANPAMIKHGVFTTTKVSDVRREERQSTQGKALIYTTLLLETTFWAQDGSSVTTVTGGEAMDSGDKSMNKAMSAALKYAFFQTFTIPTQEMVDSENETHQVAPRQQMTSEQAEFNDWVKPLIGKEGLTREFVKSLVENHGYTAAKAEIIKQLGLQA